ncbi:MAG TPA: hypothetical protein VK914_03495 [bacterium]|nr:hypothetical protein [bacterium]
MPQTNYPLDEFWELCRTGQGVHLWRSAEDGARALFKLQRHQEILYAVASADVKNRRLLDAEPLRNHPPRDQPVDAYDFDLWGKKVYIAFLKAPNGSWSLKSFKEQEQVPIFSDQEERIAEGLNFLQEIRGLK